MVIKNYYYLCLIVPVLFLFAGCGGDQEREAAFKPVEDLEIPLEEEGENDPDADPRAVRGGSITTWGGPYPKSLNYWVDLTSINSDIMGLLFHSLVGLHTTEDIPQGDLAVKWDVSDDEMEFTFHLDPRAQWSDGKPVTAEDVQFYYDTMMNPDNLTSVFRVHLSRFDRPEVLDERTLLVRANEPHWMNFWTVSGMMAFPKHIWEGVDFNEITFDFPVVNGPYEIYRVRDGRAVELRRRGDWWGQAKRWNQYKYNFDLVRFRFMEDRFKALEALRIEAFDLYTIYTASIWAEQTNFSQVEKNWVVRQEVYTDEPRGFQGLAMNMRRPLFQDVRVRQALSHLLNREDMNDKLMFNQYFMLNSYYPDLWPDNRNPEAIEYHFDPERARELLAEAGYVANAAGILEKDGVPLRIQILHHGEDLRHLNIYIQDLKRVGIDASVEIINFATYRRRLDEHNFDMIWSAWGASRLRDPEPMWSSTTAQDPSSVNMPGVADDEVDAIIEQLKTIADLEQRNELLRQLDHRLTEIIPYVLMWQSDKANLLYWNRFGTPENKLGKFTREDSAIVYWWYDPEKAQLLEEARANDTALEQEPLIIRYQDK